MIGTELDASMRAPLPAAPSVADTDVLANGPAMIETHAQTNAPVQVDGPVVLDEGAQDGGPLLADAFHPKILSICLLVQFERLKKDQREVQRKRRRSALTSCGCGETLIF